MRAPPRPVRPCTRPRRLAATAVALVLSVAAAPNAHGQARRRPVRPASEQTASRLPRLDAPDTVDIEITRLPALPDTTLTSTFVERYALGRGQNAGLLVRSVVAIPGRADAAPVDSVLETTSMDVRTFAFRGSTRRIATRNGSLILDERFLRVGDRLRRVRTRAGTAPDTSEAAVPAGALIFATLPTLFRMVPLALSWRGRYLMFTTEPPFHQELVIDSVLRATPLTAPSSSTVFDVFAHRDNAGGAPAQLRASIDSTTRDVMEMDWHSSGGMRSVYRLRRDPRSAPVMARSPITTKAQPAARRAVAGHYYLEGQREVGSELLLLPNGRFQYMLAYGAMDESSEGEWTVADGRVVLQTDGVAHEPRVTLAKSLGTARDSITVLVTDVHGTPVSGIEIDIETADAGTSSAHARNGRYTYRYATGATPTAIAVGYSIVDFMPSFPLTRTPAAEYRFTFDRGDLGVRRFEAEALEIEGSDLIMPRNGRRLRYVRH